MSLLCNRCPRDRDLTLLLPRRNCPKKPKKPMQRRRPTPLVGAPARLQSNRSQQSPASRRPRVPVAKSAEHPARTDRPTCRDLAASSDRARRSAGNVGFFRVSANAKLPDRFPVLTRQTFRRTLLPRKKFSILHAQIRVCANASKDGRYRDFDRLPGRCHQPATQARRIAPQRTIARWVLHPYRMASIALQNAKRR